MSSAQEQGLISSRGLNMLQSLLADALKIGACPDDDRSFNRTFCRVIDHFGHYTLLSRR
jgi:hypothetical protein